MTGKPARRIFNGAAITGMGATSALGWGTEALWAGIEQGRDGIDVIGRFDTSGFRVHVGAVVPGVDDGPWSDVSERTRTLSRDFIVAAAREAWSHARLQERPVSASRVGVVLGTGIVDAKRPSQGLVRALAETVGAQGPCIAVTTACSSSTGALGIALDLLDEEVDVVLAGGLDVLTPWIFVGFYTLGALSEQKCAPFSFPIGTTMGEGAGVMVLERIETATGRGVDPVAYLSGYGLSADGFHETSPDPTGSGVQRAIASAIADAGLRAVDVGYVNAHGTGTANNDVPEWLGISRVLGVDIPVSSIKGHIGHAQGAAGILEAIVTVLGMRREVVPPTLHFTGKRPLGPDDPVAGATPRRLVVEHAVSTNSAFGGANAAVVLSSSGVPPRARPASRIRVAGVGVVFPHGSPFEDPSCAADPRSGSPEPSPDVMLSSVLPRADPRGLDPATCLLVTAAALALRDASIKVSGPLRDRAGLLVGTTRPSPSVFREFNRSIEARGLSRLNVEAFARLVQNAAAGSASMLLSLRGPCTTLSTGEGSGLVAIACAARMLASRDDGDLIVAGGVDELAEGERERGMCDGAACAVLVRDAKSPCPVGQRPVFLTGCSLVGPGRSEDAVDLCLERSAIRWEDVDSVYGAVRGMSRPSGPTFVDPTSRMGLAPAATDAMGFAMAMTAIRAGEIRTAVVASGHEGSASCAIVLRTTGGEDGA